MTLGQPAAAGGGMNDMLRAWNNTNPGPPAAGGAMLPSGLQYDGSEPLTSLPWTYWRKTDGWITIGQYNPTEFMRQAKKRYQPVVGYNEALTMFFLNDPKGVLNLDDWRRGGKYGPLLQAGGAIEFPVDQLIELEWHEEEKRPSVLDPRSNTWVKVEFPQLAGVNVYTEQCPACSWHTSALDLAKAQSNLRKHERAAHKETSQQTELGRIIAMSGNESNSAIGEALKLLAAGQDRLSTIVEKLLDERVMAEAASYNGPEVPEPVKRGPGRPRLLEPTRVPLGDA